MAGYGADCSTWVDDEGPDLDPTFSMLDPGDTRIVAEAIGRRLCTPRGGFEEAPDEGFDLRRFVNKPMTSVVLFQIKVGAEREAERDERVQSAWAAVSWDAKTKTLTVAVNGETVDGETFGFVISADSLSSKLLQVT